MEKFRRGSREVYRFCAPSAEAEQANLRNKRGFDLEKEPSLSAGSARQFHHEKRSDNQVGVLIRHDGLRPQSGA